MTSSSWFVEPELLPVTFSISHVCNNLSRYENNLVYVHLDDIVRVNTSQTPCTTHKINVTDKSFLHQARLVKVQDTAFIVCASEAGVDIFDLKGDKPVFHVPVKQHIKDPDDGTALFCRGICSVKTKDGFQILVGTSTGDILVIGKEEGSKPAEASASFAFVKCLTGHKYPVFYIESSSAKNGDVLVASSDDEGGIIVRNGKDLEILHRIQGDGYAATSLRFCYSDAWLAASYLHGSIRLFNREKGFVLHADLASHTRAITALESFDTFLVSAGEDTYLNVWEFCGGSKSNPRIKLASSQCIPNDLLNGIAIGDKSKQIYTSGYDTSNIKLWVPE